MLEHGKFDKAVELFEALANRTPSEANAWDSLGEGYLANGMPDKAFEAYSRALSIERISAFDSRPWPRAGGAWPLRRSAREGVARLQGPGVPAVASRPVPGGRGRSRQGRDAADEDAEVNANARLTSAWLLPSRKSTPAPSMTFEPPRRTLARPAGAFAPGGGRPPRWPG